MYLKVRCPSCGKSAAVPESDAGLAAVCLACGARYLVPHPVPEPETTASASSLETAVVESDGPSWGRLAWVAAAALVAVVVAVAAMLVVQVRPDPIDRATAARYKAQAEAAAAAGQLPEAYRKYHELDLLVGNRPVRDPETRALVDKAHADKEAVYARLLDQMARQQAEAQGRTSAATAVAAAPPDPTPPAPAAPTTPTTRAATPDPGTQPAEAVAQQDDEPPAPETQPAPEVVAVAPAPKISVPDGAAAPSTTPPSTTAPAAPAQPTVIRIRPPVQPIPEVVYGVTDEQIGRAIETGVRNLLARFDPRTHTLADVSIGNADGGGRNALAVYALMQCGQALKDERLNVRGPEMNAKITAMKHANLRKGHPQVYALGLRATALALFNRPQDRDTLKSDVSLLLQSHNGGAYWYLADPRLRRNAGTSNGPWDNSNSQYGLLGVWSGAEAGVEVPGNYWGAVDSHWEGTQLPDGQWSYSTERSGRLSMTVAGIASLFVTHDWLDAPKYGYRVGREPFSPALKKGLDWLEAGDNAVDVSSAQWWGYTIYGIERVGLASGFKYFGRHDWYRELAGRIVAQQAADGSWGDTVDTSFALLFLARGRHPILMNKLRFDGHWANRPRDVANLARYATRQLERELNWQVVPLRPLAPAEDAGTGIGGAIGFRARPSRPVNTERWSDWMDSPILYLASHKPPKLFDGDYDNLRSFVEAGGMLFTHADGDASEETDGAFDQWVQRDLVPKLFRRYEMQDLPPDHPVYNLVYKLADAERPKLRAVTNGSRVLLLHCPTDIARAWQLRDVRTKRGIFQLGVNLFLYVTGRRDLRNRLESTYVSDPGPAEGEATTVQVARLEYSGNWDPEPGAWRRFGRWFRRETGAAVQVRQAGLSSLSLDPRVVPLAHLTGTARHDFSDADAVAVRQYVEAGGVLLVDHCGGAGAFDQSVQDTLLAKAFPGVQLKPMRTEQHPLFQAGPPGTGLDDLTKPKLRPFAPDRLGNLDRPFLSLAAGHGRVIFTPVDLTSGLLGTRTWGIAGFEADYAQSFLKNLLFWTADGKPEAPAPAPTSQPATGAAS